MAAHSRRWVVREQWVEHTVVNHACMNRRITTYSGPEGHLGCVDMIGVNDMFSQEVPLRTQLVRRNGAEEVGGVRCYSHADEQGSRVPQVCPKGIVFMGVRQSGMCYDIRVLASAEGPTHSEGDCAVGATHYVHKVNARTTAI